MKLFSGLLAFATVSFLQSSFAQEYSKVIAVMPIESHEVATDLGAEIGKRLHEELVSGGMKCISSEGMGQFLENVESGDDHAVQIRGAKQLGADIILRGTIEKSAGAYVLSVKMVDVQSDATLVSRIFKCPCTLTTLLTTLPVQAVAAIKKDLESQVQEDIQPPPLAVATEEPEVDDEFNPHEYRDPVYQFLGITNGIVIGISGRTALGNLRKDESQWGAEMHLVIPVTKSTHLRTRLALPAARSSEMVKNSSLEMPDPMSSLEYEWGRSHFGVSFGAAYMLMLPFKQSIDEYYGVTDYQYDTYHAWNWVFGFRAGRPNAGFRGRICYPMPMVADYDGNIEDFFVEYSGFGMFGKERFKAGVGVQGYFKRRTSDTLWRSPEEFFALVPCGKVSFLAGQHNLVSIGLDLVGLISPKASDRWSPNLTLSYTFSFAPFEAAETFDGKF